MKHSKIFTLSGFIIEHITNPKAVFKWEPQEKKKKRNTIHTFCIGCYNLAAIKDSINASSMKVIIIMLSSWVSGPNQ